MPVNMEKSPPELIETFERVFPGDPRAQKKQMFGYPAGFVNGNMFGGLFADGVILRLSEADRRIIVEQHGAQTFEPMQGRPMKEYVRAPATIVANPEELREWVKRAFDYGASLPPKESKPPKASKTRK